MRDRRSFTSNIPNLIILWIALLYNFIIPANCGCGSPPRVMHAELKEEYIDKNIFNAGSVVQYVCQPGYLRVLGKKNTAICLEDFTWSDPELVCKPRTCGYPGEIENGYFEAADFLLGSRVTYFCDKGYRMISRVNYRICQADGLWSNSVPECNAVICPPPEPISNGTFHPVKDEYGYLDTVRYECDAYNAVLGDDSYVFCMSNGTWSSEPPTCQDVDCSNPNVPNSVKISGFVGPYRMNSAVRFKCDKGYLMKGSDTVTCNINSEWEPKLPECLKDSTISERSCPKPKIANGCISPDKEDYEPYSRVKVECSKDYALKGNNIIQCSGNSKWHPEVPKCVPKEFCLPPKIYHGYIDEGEPRYYPDWQENGYNMGDSVKVKCEFKYKLKGDNNIVCGSGFKWLPRIPICEHRFGCPYPEIENGHIVLRNGKDYDPISDYSFFWKTTVHVQCDPGFRMIGSSYSKCVNSYFSLKWSPELPVCV